MNDRGPWEDYGVEGGGGVNGDGLGESNPPGIPYTTKNLPALATLSPAEQADSAAFEGRNREANLARIEGELGRKGLSEKQRGVLEEEKKRLRAEPTGEEPGPWADYGGGQPSAEPPKDEGFFSTLKNPLTLWTEESMPARLVSAYKKGVFDKPVGELVHGAADAVKDFSVSELWEAAKKNPGKMAGELVNAVVADPYLLLAPMGLGGRLAASVGVKGLSTAGRLGQVAGRVVEGGLVGGAIEAPISAAEQLDERGFIDPAKLSQDMGVSAAMGAAMSGVLSLGAGMAKSRPQELADAVKAKLEEGTNSLRATEEVLRERGVSGKKARELTDALEPYRDEPALEAAAAKERIASGEAKEVGTEPSALAAREEFLNAKRTLTPSQMKELEDIKLYREVLPELDVSPEVADAMTPSAAKRYVDARLPEAPMETFAKVEGRRALEGGNIDPKLAAGLALGGGALAAIPLLPEEKRGQALAGLGLGAAALALGGKGLRRGGRAGVDAVERMFEESPAKAKQVVQRAWKERGVMDPEMSKYIGLTMGGAAIGGYLSDDKANGAALGAALGLGGPMALRAAKRIAGDGIERIKASAVGQKVSGALEKRNPEIARTVDDMLSTHEGTVASGGLEAMRTKHAIKTLVPDEARRSELIHAIQEGRVADLPANERSAAETYQKVMAELGDWAQKEGVLDALIDDGTYVTQLWKDGEKAKALFSGGSGKSGFAEDRLIPSYKKGIELGLEPKTLDLAEIADIYSKSISKTVANKKLLERIAGEVLPDGRPAAVPNEGAPLDYVPVNHPQLFGARVHPELAPALSHFFYSNEIPAYVRAASAVSAVAKRGLFSLSGFHLKSLLDVSLGLAAGLMTPKTLTKIPTMYRMLKEGRMGDFADQMVRAGLKIDPHSGIDMDNDIFRGIAKSAEAIAKDLPIPGAHLPVKALRKLDEGIQFALWEYMHPAMKLSAASAMFEKALLSGDSRAPQVIQREIAQATNDLFGGVNWRHVANGVQNKFLNEMANSVTNPQGLRVQRIALLAPDWTIATARAGYKGLGAIGKKLTGQPLNVREQMYARAFLGGALMYATIADGLNMAMSGHHFWENADPTYVDMGDGRKLQLSKHFMEPFHWLMDPGKAALNKMGYVPKEALEQMTGKEFLTTSGGPPMADKSLPGRIWHAMKGMAPIGTQQPSVGAATAGAIGLPIYGKTKAEERRAKREREQSRRRNRRIKRERRR